MYRLFIIELVGTNFSWFLIMPNHLLTST